MAWKMPEACYDIGELVLGRNLVGPGLRVGWIALYPEGPKVGLNQTPFGWGGLKLVRTLDIQGVAPSVCPGAIPVDNKNL